MRKAGALSQGKGFGNLAGLSLPKTISGYSDGEVHRDIASDDAAAVLNGPTKWRIFPQAEMGSV